MTRAEGPFVWDVDGNRFTDFLLGYGPVVLGHAQPDVMAAAVAQLSTGNCIAPLWSPRQVELAHLLTETLPGAESALLLKTGSDATSAAIRLARAFTGRDLVLRCGYHGWHDWAVEQPGGVVSAVRAHTVPFPLR
ncbi:MAG: aminotransferase class III-fold pyridoxal phosphate-dependent enzyme [Candidatus Microthrix sp.]|nr:aminotransferase class III-fold pyridoxal phosphate-dependent enzyme [Candidatus Microthrix sp.]